MNKVILMGRLTRDAQTRYAEGAEPMAIHDLHWQLTGECEVIRKDSQLTSFPV